MSEILAFEAPLRSAQAQALLGLDQVILDALPLGIYACDSAGRILRVNRRAVELWGQAPRPKDTHVRFSGAFHVETLDGVPLPPDQTPMAQALREGRGCQGVEAIVQNADGRRWAASVTIEPLRGADGEVVGAVNCFQDISREVAQRRAMAEQQRTLDLAMTAARMGAWRYTVADNICLYDAHAQRLYGLSSPRFLHDEDGVTRMIHADDIEGMWAAVARACEPDGDGHYNVEYRVRRPDGDWRWLSAWGIVEFDGEGAQRKPVAISGASRDLTEIKDAEEHQRLLINELNHRVKNSLATVQSIASQTLRSTGDIPAARAAIDARIQSLAAAHDLLTQRSWSGADLAEVVARAIEPFPIDRFRTGGAPVRLTPSQALAFSMALHELATNATKYGALGVPGGSVEIAWTIDAGVLTFRWRERGGPPVTAPTRRGFGSRLIEEGLSRELGGRTRLDYEPGGVACEITAQL